ncbi:MAG: Mut7-C RNAse domain-containing protein [Acidimicrobiia bacterium]|nr:Mut7-C RNAse domain-containing protein [Acidimicrobiia bacterium]
MDLSVPGSSGSIWSEAELMPPAADDVTKAARLRFYGELAELVTSGEPSVTVVVDDAPSVKDRIEACGVPHTEVDLIVVNGSSVAFDYQLLPGDRVGVYPVFRSLPVQAKLRPEPPLGRFVVDVNLGRLAKHLRLLGFDALSDGSLPDRDLAEVSATQDRILLTKDRNLLKRSIVVHGYLVREVLPKDQLAEVVRRFDLAPSIQPFTRCIECNGRVGAVAKAEIDHLLEPLTRQHYDDFGRCGDCGRVFWRGSHYDHLAGFVAELRRRV